MAAYLYEAYSGGLQALEASLPNPVVTWRNAMADTNPKNLEQVLERIDQATRDRSEVSLGEVMEELGHRSFGPVLVFTGVIMSVPVVGDIPGVPTVLALVVALVAVQLLIGRKHFWLPQFLLRRSVSADKVCRSLGWARKPAAFIDRGLKPRMTYLAKGAEARLIAAVALCIAAITPLTEVVPFSANVAGAALTAYGLALIADDGLVAIIASAFALGIGLLLGYSFLGG